MSGLSSNTITCWLILWTDFNEFKIWRNASFTFEHKFVSINCFRALSPFDKTIPLLIKYVTNITRNDVYLMYFKSHTFDKLFVLFTKSDTVLTNEKMCVPVVSNRPLSTHWSLHLLQYDHWYINTPTFDSLSLL